MIKTFYRSFLLMLLTFVCVLLYYATDDYFENLNNKQYVNSESVYSINSEINIKNENIPDNTENATEAVHMVMPSGEPIGIYVKTDGVMVIDTGEVIGTDGKRYSPCNGFIQQGDYILSINNIEIEDKNDLIDMVNKSCGNEIQLKIRRDGKTLFQSVIPVKGKDNCYFLGLWVKDDISGIGTLTFIDEYGFSALGHSINDYDTGEIFEISDGAIYFAKLINIVKANGSVPGRLEGMIDYSSDNIVGRIEANSNFGINGYLTQTGKERLQQGEWLPVAKKEEIHLGRAYIVSSISGKKEYYEINITDIDLSTQNESKGIEIKVTDSKLLTMTSGIVQGMSGSPIIQDGKIIGAVTHVLVNDPTRGYAIFIENMLEHDK